MLFLKTKEVSKALNYLPEIVYQNNIQLNQHKEHLTSGY